MVVMSPIALRFSSLILGCRQSWLLTNKRLEGSPLASSVDAAVVEKQDGVMFFTGNRLTPIDGHRFDGCTPQRSLRAPSGVCPFQIIVTSWAQSSRLCRIYGDGAQRTTYGSYNNLCVRYMVVPYHHLVR